MPIRIEIIGDTPGQANLRLIGLGPEGVPAGATMSLEKNQGGERHLGSDGAWHAEDQPLPPPSLAPDGTAWVARVGPDLVDPLAALKPSEMVALTLRWPGGGTSGRVKVDGLFPSSLAAPQQPAPPPPLIEPEAPPPPPHHQPSWGRWGLLLGLIVLLLAAGGIYYALVLHKPVVPGPPPALPVPSGRIETQQDLGPYIATNPPAEEAVTRARDLARRGKLDLAMMLYRYAARTGSTDAAMALGEMYDPASWSPQTSPMTKPDAETAAYWYEPAAKAGDPVAQRRLGKILLDLYPGGFQHDSGLGWLRKAKEAGDAEAGAILDTVP